MNPAITQISIANCSSLQTVTISQCTKLNKLNLKGLSGINDLDLSLSTAIKNLDITGTAITNQHISFELPAGTTSFTVNDVIELISDYSLITNVSGADYTSGIFSNIEGDTVTFDYAAGKNVQGNDITLKYTVTNNS